MDQTQANGWVQMPVAQAIFKDAGQDLAALSAAAKQKGFKPVPLGLKVSFGFDNAIRRSSSNNVVGILPGTERPDEYVLYSAHWDHLGHCTPDATGDDICNGAVDNATGVAALTALAEANVKAGPARAQPGVHRADAGGIGPAGFGILRRQNPVYPLDHTVGGVNMDALLPGAAREDYAMTGGDKSDLTDLFREALARKGPWTKCPRTIRRSGGLLPFGPFQLRQARRADVRYWPRHRPGRGRQGRGREAGRGLYRQPLSPPSDEYSEAGTGPGIQEDAKCITRWAGRWPTSDCVAQLAQGRRIPRHPRQGLRRCDRRLPQVSVTQLADAARMASAGLDLDRFSA